MDTTLDELDDVSVWRAGPLYTVVSLEKAKTRRAS